MDQLIISLLLVALGIVILFGLSRIAHRELTLKGRSGPIGFAISFVLIAALIVVIRFGSDSETGALFGYVPTKDESAEPPVWLQVLEVGALFIAMCLGMTSKFFWDALEAQKPRGKLVLRWTALIRPFLVAPLVFGFIWKTSGGKLDVIAACLSYQNGFMWQTVLGKVKVA